MTAVVERVEHAGIARRCTRSVALRRIGAAARDGPTFARSGAHGCAAPRARRAGAGARAVFERAAHADRLIRRCRRTAGQRGRRGGRRAGGARRGPRQALQHERVAIAARVGALGSRSLRR